MICLVTCTAYEAAELLTKVEIKETTTEGLITLDLCEYDGIQFLLLLTGYGKLNVGLGLGYAVARYEISTVIGFGDCASINRCLHEIGTVAILTNALETDVNFMPLGYPETVVPGMDRGTYTANQKLISCAQAVCEEKSISYHMGSIGSLEEFVCNSAVGERIRRGYGVEYLDNESGPWGQAACIFGIPFILIKGVSNYGDGNAVSDYENCSKVANKRSCRVVYQLLAKLLSS